MAYNIKSYFLFFCSFMLETNNQKINICQRSKKNKLNLKGKQDYVFLTSLVLSFAEIAYIFQKTRLFCVILILRFLDI